jgi:hypothetical protein
MGRLLHLSVAERDVTYRLETDDSIMFSDSQKGVNNMLTSILGARLSWHFANGWVFEPAIVGPDIVDYTLKEGPHAGRIGPGTSSMMRAISR